MKLTKPQQLIYDMEKFSGGAIATICGSILLKGTADKEKIQNAVNKIIELNDALRIRIVEKNGITNQTISDFVPKEIVMLKFKNKDEFVKYAENIAKEPMDIYGNLFEVYGVDVDDKFGIIVKIHHIVSDAWTLSLMGSQFYEFINGKTITSESYTNYIESEDKYLNSKRYEKDREFWIDTFTKCDEPTYLSDIVTKNTISNRLTFVIDKEKANIISEYANKTNSSMYSVLMTAVAVYFNRVKNNLEKFYIGTAVLNRNGQSEKNTMGMFINTVPILIELDNDKTFEENMENIIQNSFSAFRHQKFNYGDILKSVREEFKFEEKLYDVIFSYQNAKVTSDEIETEWYHCGSQNESISIHIDDRDDRGILRVHYDYNIEKFTESAITRMHGHIFNLLTDAICDFLGGYKKISALKLMSIDEYNMIVKDFNNTYIDYPKDKCVHTIFEEQVSNKPKKIAVIASDKTLTYEELNNQSNRIANALLDRGIKSNDVVAFILPRKSYLLSVIFGILKCGAAYMPIDPDYPQDRIEYMLNDSGAKFCVTEDNVNYLLQNNSINYLKNRINIESRYCVIYTSGSTGKPKGCCLKHKGIVNFCVNSNVINYFKQIKEEPIGISINNVTFDFFIAENIVLLLNGYQTILCSKEDSISPKKFWEICEKYNVNLIQTTPTRYKILLKEEFISEKIDIKLTVSSGETLTPELYKKLKINLDSVIFNPMGPTECSVWVPNGEM